VRRTEQAGQVRHHATRLMPEQMLQQRSSFTRRGHDP
jgi:hypothetical protein